MFEVDGNKCDCHPDLCSCDDWAIYKNGDKHSTYFDLETAKEVCNALNNTQYNPIPDNSRLLNLYVQGGDCSFMDDDEPFWTVGLYSETEDRFIVLGWDWCHDTFTEDREAKVLGWSPIR